MGVHDRKNTQELHQTALSRFSNEFAYQLSRYFNTLSYALVMRILSDLSYPELSKDSLSLVAQFAHKERPLELVEQLLNTFLLHCFSQNTTYVDQLTQEELHISIAYCLQNQPIEDICANSGLTGKKQLKKSLIECLNKLLS